MIFVILILLFSNFIEKQTGFSYIDELVLVFALGIFLKRCCTCVIKIEKHDYLILILTMILYGVGALSSWVNGYQNIGYALLSGIFSIKFYLAYILFKLILPRNIGYYEKLWKTMGVLSEILLCTVAIIVLFDQFFHIWTYSERRYGVLTTGFIFAHPTQLACFAIILVTYALFYRGRLGKQLAIRYNIIPAFIIIFVTGRTKAIAYMVILIVIFMLDKRRDAFKINWKYFLLIPVFLIVAWDKIVYYVDITSSRGIMYYTSILIARDHFPLGAGFATFGTEFSRRSYSVLYRQYGISSVWGLSERFGSYITDTTWPGILAETGFWGLIISVGIIFLFFRKMKRLNADKYVKRLLVLILIYILIETTGESILMSERGVSIALLLALIFSYAEILWRNSKDSVMK